jgi:hypothetical protein
MSMLICVHSVTPEVLGLFAINAKVSDLKGITRYVHPHEVVRQPTPRYAAAAIQPRLMTSKCAPLFGGPSPRLVS